MNRTKIEWVKNPDGSQGYTLNPLSGCKNHTPEGLCLDGLFPCYAYKLANGRLKPLYLANKNAAPIGVDSDGIKWCGKFDLENPFYPRFWEEREWIPIRDRKPKGIFVCDMGDLFGIGIPHEWTKKVISTIYASPQHRFYLLTKQPQNLIKFSPFPENCWVGVTATNQQSFLDAVYSLVHIKASVRYISFEPLLGEIPMTPEQLRASCNWFIIGACTGTYGEMLNLADRLYRDKEQATFVKAMRIKEFGKKYTLHPKIEWVREIVEAADKAGIPVFLKDNLSPLLKWPDSGSWAFKDQSNMLRQEMPIEQ